MDLYQILKTHNREWTAREIICFLAAYFFIFCFLMYQYTSKKIKISQIIGLMLTVAFLAVVFASTVFTRIPENECRAELELFWSWKAVLSGNKEMLKENLLNCMLLFPFGMLLPWDFQKGLKSGYALGAGVIVSFLIEFLQFVLKRGLFEWDDMIHNALGCMAGCFCMNICISLFRMIRNKKAGCK